MAALSAPVSIAPPPSEDAEDRTCLDGFVCRGDRAAIEKLFRRHAAAMWRVAARHAGSAAADDAVQEAFVAAMRQAATFRGSGPATVRGWLLALAANAGRMLARSAERRSRREQAVIPPSPPNEPGSGPDGELVSAALAALPQPERLAVVLHHADGLSHHEVAQALACSVVAARKRVQRGLERMRTFLARRGVTCPTAVLALTVGQSAVLAHSATAVEIGVACATSGPLAQAPSWLALIGHQGALAAKIVGSTVLAKAGVAAVLAVCLVLGFAVATADPPLPPLGKAMIAPAVDPIVREAVATPVRLDLRRSTLAEAIALVRLQVRVRVTCPDELGYRPDGSPIFLTLRCTDSAEAALAAIAQAVGAELVLAGDACHLIVRQEPGVLAAAAADLQGQDPARWLAARASLVRGHDPSGLASLALHDLRRDRARASRPEALQIVHLRHTPPMPGDPWGWVEDPWSRWRAGAQVRTSDQAIEVQDEALALLRLASQAAEIRQAVRQVLAGAADTKPTPSRLISYYQGQREFLVTGATEKALWVGGALGMAEIQPVLVAQVERGLQVPSFWQALRYGALPRQRAYSAVILLGLLGSAADAPARWRGLVSALEPGAQELRHAACEAFGRSGDPAALSVLSTLLSARRSVALADFSDSVQQAIAELGRRPAMRAAAARVWIIGWSKGSIGQDWLPAPSIPLELVPEVLGMLATMKPGSNSRTATRALAAALGPWSDLPQVRQAILIESKASKPHRSSLLATLAALPDPELANLLIGELESFPDLRRAGAEQFGRFYDLMNALAATSQPQAVAWFTNGIAKLARTRTGGPPFFNPNMQPNLLVSALGSIRTPAAEEALRGLLVQSDPPGGGELAKALVEVRSALQPELMRQCLEHPTASVRQWAVELLRKAFPPAEALTFCERLLNDPDVEVRARALIHMVSWLHPEDHQRNLALIAQRLADPQVEIRRGAARALFNPQRAPYVPLALVALDDHDDQVKQAAAQALAAVASRRPEVPGLEPYRAQVQTALSQLHAASANDVRDAAARALVEWGGQYPQPEAQPATTQPTTLAPSPQPAPLPVPSAPERPEAPVRDGGGF